MLKLRLVYLGLIILTIIAGLVSREMSESVVPLFVGDILWGLVVCLTFRLIIIKKPLRYALFFSLCYCYATEFSQLYKAPWIDNLRPTFFGRVLLGETFYWGDIASYTIGVALGVLVELSIRKMRSEEIHMTPSTAN